MKSAFVGTCLLVVSFVVAGSVTAQKVGGYRDASPSSREVIDAARFAVATQMAKEKNTGRFVLTGITSAQSQVVAGVNYKMFLKVLVNKEAKEAEAVVWHKLDRTHELTSWTWLAPR